MNREEYKEGVLKDRMESLEEYIANLKKFTKKLEAITERKLWDNIGLDCHVLTTFRKIDWEVKLFLEEFPAEELFLKELPVEWEGKENE